MHGLVAAGRPASSFGDKPGMVHSANDELPRSLLLEMTLDTEIVVSLRQHFGIHRPVWIVANGAALPDGLMFEYERSALRDLTLAAGIPFGGERGSAVDRISFVGIVAIAATDFSFDDRMMRCQVKLAAFIKMALETSLWVLSRVDDGIAGTAA